jgi:hypothetical protein
MCAEPASVNVEQRLTLLRQAADAVAAVEASCLGMSGTSPGEYLLRDRAARRVDSDVLGLPVEWSEPGSVAPIAVVKLPTAASEIRLGKYSTLARLRVRAFYHGPDGGLALKVVNAPDDRRLKWERAARRRLRRTLRRFAPQLVDAGEHVGVAWMLEQVLRGSHPLTVRAQDEAAANLASRLVRLHRTDRELVPVTSLLGADAVARLRHNAGSSQTQGVAADVAMRAANAAESLVSRHGDSQVQIGWSHGDVGFGNVVVLGVDARLVDWEQIGRRALGFDLVKLLSNSAKPDNHLDRFTELTSSDRRFRRRVLPFDAQVAVAGLLMLSRATETLARANEVGRGTLALNTVTQRSTFVDLLIRRAGLAG